ncbi:serine/arginine-rich splicing factor 4-like [Dreissena polymorpha]|uniref:EF-hand domain-containing protein n=1 Tax=Dreissena polymorpha TaxID=45954 RepID=A0A9D4RA20_DREPO|nr:serine/arginine-rich splicing factor 4-like [Dreissena polymorpha]KAH3859798.1 hypothetical protein DPMN_102621 [Dreissena polymorpha]
MGDFAKLPSKKKLEGTFYDYSGGQKTMDLENFKRLCYKYYLAPTTKAACELFTQLDKDSDSLLSFDEVVALMEKQWTPINERKVTFLEDLRKCRKKTGPINRDELREILQQNSEEALTDEDVDYCFDKLDINGDKEISEEEICELIFKMEDLMSREPSRVEITLKSEKKDKKDEKKDKTDEKKDKKDEKKEKNENQENHKSRSRSRSNSGSRKGSAKHRKGSGKKKSRSRSSSSSSGKGSRQGSAHQKKTEEVNDYQLIPEPERGPDEMFTAEHVATETELGEQKLEKGEGINAKITAPSGDHPSNFQDMSPMVSGPAADKKPTQKALTNDADADGENIEEDHDIMDEEMEETEEIKETEETEEHEETEEIEETELPKAKSTEKAKAK